MARCGGRKVRAIVAGCNQSSTNAGSHIHSSRDRAVPSALRLCGCDILTQITCWRGQRGGGCYLPASLHHHPLTCTNTHTHKVEFLLGFPALIITMHLIQGCCVLLAQMSVWLWGSWEDCCCILCVDLSALHSCESFSDCSLSMVTCNHMDEYWTLCFIYYQK